MHEVALSAGPVAVILIGILFGVFYNQRGLNRLASRIEGPNKRGDAFETRMEDNFASLLGTLESIRGDIRKLGYILGQHEEAIVIIKKRLEL